MKLSSEGYTIEQKFYSRFTINQRREWVPRKNNVSLEEVNEFLTKMERRYDFISSRNTPHLVLAYKEKRKEPEETALENYCDVRIREGLVLKVSKDT